LEQFQKGNNTKGEQIATVSTYEDAMSTYKPCES